VLVSYARTSTTDQEAGLEAQIKALTDIGSDRIFSEQVSSIATRPKLEEAIDFVREGDVFTVTRLDRLARSVFDLIAITNRLEAKGVTLKVLDMGLDTSTSTGRLVLNVIGSIAQFERELMLERQRDGIARAKRLGKYKGRVPTARNKAKEMVSLKNAGVKPSEIATRLKLSKASVYRILAESRQQGS
jgi:DNA invertase Pin-like site-specific DNA recombinase